MEDSLIRNEIRAIEAKQKKSGCPEYSELGPSCLLPKRRNRFTNNDYRRQIYSEQISQPNYGSQKNCMMGSY